MSRAALDHQRRRTHAAAAARIARYLAAAGVKIGDVDFTSRRMEIAAPAGVLTALFRANVGLFSDGVRTFRARTGTLWIPRAIAPWTRAVVGFDQRPLPMRAAVESDAGAQALWPTQVAGLYQVPLDRNLAHQCVGLIALGGGYQPDDLAKAMSGMGRAPPTVVEVSVGGAVNNFGVDDVADEEIALDLQVLAALAQGARVVIYFAENNQQALADAIDKAVHDAANQPKVISVSWGGPELHWTAPRREALNATLSDAIRLGVCVVAAAGDDLATCKEPDGKAHVWFPASSPYVLSCGGTTIELDGDRIVKERAWNTGDQGTGGGVSEYLPTAAFQSKAGVPLSVSTGASGRGVPDVAAMASETPGYRIVVNGEMRNLGGTSAGTPLWAGIVAIANGARKSSLGHVNPRLYAKPECAREIIEGDNRFNDVGYSAGGGWNACAGLGVPIGDRLIEILTATTS